MWYDGSVEGVVRQHPIPYWVERTEQCQWEEVKLADLTVQSGFGKLWDVESEKDVRSMGESSVITLSVSNSSSGTQQFIERGNTSKLPHKIVRGLHELI